MLGMFVWVYHYMHYGVWLCVRLPVTDTLRNTRACRMYPVSAAREDRPTALEVVLGSGVIDNTIADCATWGRECPCSAYVHVHEILLTWTCGGIEWCLLLCSSMLTCTRSVPCGLAMLLKAANEQHRHFQGWALAHMLK